MRGLMLAVFGASVFCAVEYLLMATLTGIGLSLSRDYLAVVVGIAAMGFIFFIRDPDIGDKFCCIAIGVALLALPIGFSPFGQNVDWRGAIVVSMACGIAALWIANWKNTLDIRDIQFDHAVLMVMCLFGGSAIPRMVTARGEYGDAIGLAFILLAPPALIYAYNRWGERILNRMRRAPA